MRKSILFILLFSATVFASCRKDSPDVVHPTEISLTIYTENYWSDMFDTYWTTMSQSYVFWKHETVDWDAIYSEFAPQFEDCDDLCMNDPDTYFTYSDKTNDKGELMYYGDLTAAKLFYNITTQLLDHHYMFGLSDIGLSMPGSAGVDIPSRDYYHAYNNVGMYEGLKYILDYEQTSGRITSVKHGQYEMIDGFNGYLSTFSYLIDGSIPYLYFSDFGFSSFDDDTEENPGLETPLDPNDDTKSEVLENFEYLVKNTPNMKAAIIDVRGNGGGINIDLNVLLGRFINQDEKVSFGSTIHKSGPNRYDYTQHAPCYIYGTSEEQTYRFPIVVLADLNSISMAEIFCFASRGFSDETIILGERTYGGTCSLEDDVRFAAGKIETDNFEIYSSSVLFYDLDGNFYEGVGITPDIEVLFEESTWGTTTTDKQKEAAIEYINSL